MMLVIWWFLPGFLGVGGERAAPEMHHVVQCVRGIEGSTERETVELGVGPVEVADDAFAVNEVGVAAEVDLPCRLDGLSPAARVCSAACWTKSR